MDKWLRRISVRDAWAIVLGGFALMFIASPRGLNIGDGAAIIGALAVVAGVVILTHGHLHHWLRQQSWWVVVAFAAAMTMLIYLIKE